MEVFLTCCFVLIVSCLQCAVSEEGSIRFVNIFMIIIIIVIHDLNITTQYLRIIILYAIINNNNNNNLCEY